jgi:signal transduction histidine kinase
MKKQGFEPCDDTAETDLLAALFEGLGEGALLTDAETRVTRFGGAAQIITGRSAQEVLGMTWGEALGCAEGDEGPFLEQECSEGWAQTVCRGRRADGTSLLLRVRSRCIRNRHGRASGSVLLFSEASLQESLQRRFVAYQRLAGLGELSAALVHEVGNPVSVILGFAHLLMQQDGGDPGGEIRERIYLEAKRCRTIVDQLLDYARSSSRTSTPAPMSLREVALEVAGLLSYRLRSRGIETEIEWSPEVPLVRADAGEMKQVFLNLLINALDASQSGGRVRIAGLPFPRDVSVGGDSLLRPRPTVVREVWARVLVEDEGTGLGGGDPERFFAPFYSTKEKGGGLGLAVCRRIAEQLGGTLRLETRERGGARAILELPGCSSA